MTSSSSFRPPLQGVIHHELRPVGGVNLEGQSDDSLIQQFNAYYGPMRMTAAEITPGAGDAPSASRALPPHPKPRQIESSLGYRFRPRAVDE